MRVGGANDRFQGFSSSSDTDDLGELAIENLTVTSADFAAVNLGLHGRVAVTDVDVVGAAGCGISVDGDARARVTRYRYLHGNATALVAGIFFGSGEIDATDVVVDDAFRGAFMPRGVLRLTRAQLTSREAAVQAGDLNEISGSSIGLDFQADLPTDRLAIHGSRIQTAGPAVVVANPCVADLGTAAVPGNNRFDAADGPALVDERTNPGPAIDAHGTTLNGQDFVGDFLGPVTTPAYQLMGPNTIRF